MTHPALKCLRKHRAYLSVQTGGQSSVYAYCGESEAIAIGVSPVPMAQGMCVKMELVSEAIKFQSAQEFLRLLQRSLEKYDISVAETSQSAVVFSFTLPNILRESGHFIPDRLPIFLEEYEDLLKIVQLVCGVFEYCIEWTEPNEQAIENWTTLTMFGVKEYVTVH